MSQSQVSQVKQSPMNPLRWLLILSCGHEVWITRKTRPTRQRISCPDCTQAAQQAQKRQG